MNDAPRTHSQARCNFGRGCPTCTGLSWAELNDREADRETYESDRAAAESEGWHEWRTR